MANLPHVVLFAEDHAAFGETRRANVCQHGPTTRTLEATVVPIAVQRVQEKTFHDFAAAPRAYFHCIVVVIVVVVIVGDGGVVVGVVGPVRGGARAGEGGMLVVVVRVLLVGPVGVACNNSSCQNKAIKKVSFGKTKFSEIGFHRYLICRN